MTTPESERLETELSLLESMYPEQIQYRAKAREVGYKTENGGFALRLPPTYPDALPEVLAANLGKRDVRQQLKGRVKDCSVGEEVLDSIISVFNDMIESSGQQDSTESLGPGRSDASTEQNEGKATVIVWLHHLLNTNKRKQALSPSSKAVSGLTKPGYPGVLMYSGPSKAVHEHVNELKQQNWQAFQVRLETEDQWKYSHGDGVREVEAMKDVVAELSETNKAIFLEAMRMK